MDQPPSFRAAIGGATTFATDTLARSQLPMAPSGGAPAPFDGLDASRLSGPTGSHPLSTVELHELVTRPTAGLEGAIEIDGPARVGEAIQGRIRIRARRQISARSAVLRLVGVRLTEQSREATPQPDAAQQVALGLAGIDAGLSKLGVSMTSSSSSSSTTQPTPVRWVEVHGSIIEGLPFTEPALPAMLTAGQMIELPFTIPAPRLGPPSAHAGVAAIAWAVEAHWDIGMGADERVAALVDVRQHPDLLRAGVLTLPSGAMNDVVQDEGAGITVNPIPPVPAGTPVAVSIAWPDAPGGRSARVELTADVGGATGVSVVVSSVVADQDALAGTQVSLPVPADAPPTMATDGLTVGYRVRVIVDRKMRSDESRERPIAIC